MNNPLLKKLLPHLIAVAIAVVMSLIYFTPFLSGKVLKQHDVQQWQGTFHEIAEFQKKTGERTFWTNSIFSGMPSYLIGADYHNNFTVSINNFVGQVLHGPMYTLLVMFVSFYILMLTFGVSPWLATLGGLAFMLSSFNFINFDAGHMTKGDAIGFIPLVLAGINLTLRRNKLMGAALTGIALSFELAAGHLQISYYLVMLIAVWMIAEAYIAIKEKRVVHFLVCGVYLGIAAALAVGTNVTALMATEEYGKYSIRGTSELTKDADGKTTAGNASSGLDKDYALQYSNGVSEPFTLLIPSFYGGASNDELPTSSETFQLLKQNGVPNPKQAIQNMPVYWGTQPFTAGPQYYGAIVCFLFIFGLFIVKGPTKWWIFAVSVLTIALSMGKNFMALTDIFFFHFPLYNKFRSVTFILSLTQVLFPLLGILALRDVINNKVSKDEIKKKLLYSLYIVGGLCLFFALLPGVFFDFTSPIDERMPEWIRPALIADRETAMRTDAIRSLFFIGAAFTVLWFYLSGRFKATYLVGALALLCVTDLWLVDKRYLNEKDFETKKKNTDQQFVKTQADEMILQDPDPNYRVYNTTQNLTQDATTAYWHKSIGGYHGAKLRRYQDLLEFYVSRGNMEVYNMLNVKYFIVADSSGQQLYPQRNPMANGNAWFVKEYVMVDNANAEIDSIGNFNSKEKAFIDKRFADQLSNFKMDFDSSARIEETTYAPNALTYKYHAATPQMAVFSEIFYDKGWNAYVDGNLVPHFRCDYVLRGMIVPAGDHKLEFKFEPQVVVVGESIALASSVLLYGTITLTLVLFIIRSRKQEKEKPQAKA